MTVTAKSLGAATSPASDARGVRGGRVDDVDVGRAHGRNTLAAGPSGISRCPASWSSGARRLRTASRTDAAGHYAVRTPGGSWWIPGSGAATRLVRLMAPGLLLIPPALVWTTEFWPSRVSWTLMLLFVGMVLGCLNAWYWVKRESGHG